MVGTKRLGLSLHGFKGRPELVGYVQYVPRLGPKVAHDRRRRIKKLKGAPGALGSWKLRSSKAKRVGRRADEEQIRRCKEVLCDRRPRGRRGQLNCRLELRRLDYREILPPSAAFRDLSPSVLVARPPRDSKNTTCVAQFASRHRMNVGLLWCLRRAAILQRFFPLSQHLRWSLTRWSRIEYVGLHPLPRHKMEAEMWREKIVRAVHLDELMSWFKLMKILETEASLTNESLQ